MSSLTCCRPDPAEYAHAYGSYVDLVPETDILPAMAGELDATSSCLRQVSEQVALIRHAPYTWSIKQVLGHIIDCERIFAERARAYPVCFAQEVLHLRQGVAANDVNFDVSPPRLAQLLRLSLRVRFKSQQHVGLA